MKVMSVFNRLRGPFGAAFALGGVGLTLAFFTGCQPKSEDAPDVILLQTGRLRGNVYPTSLQNIAPLQHYPYLAGYVKKVREEAAETGARVVLVDLGDSLDGSFASHATQHGNMIAFFNALDYDAVVLGNLDNNIEAGVIGKIEASVLCPFAGPDGKPATPGSEFGVRLDQNGLPVEILANFYGDTPQSDYPDRFPSWFGNHVSGIAPLRDYAPVVAGFGPALPGTLSVLTWMKFESPKNPPETFLATLRELGVDAILAHRIYSGGERDIWAPRTFLDWKPPVSENILRNNGGFTMARLDMKRDGDGWRVVRQELVPMTANTAPKDQAIIDEIGAFAQVISSADMPVADLAESMDEEQILTGYLLALAEVPGTDVAAYSRNSVRAEWPAGKLTASRIYNSLPWTTGVVQVQIQPGLLEKFGEISGMVFLTRRDLQSDRPLVVTTSRFFATILSKHFQLPPDATTGQPHASEFDYFVSFLSERPEPIAFKIPEGWAFMDPRN